MINNIDITNEQDLKKFSNQKYTRANSIIEKSDSEVTFAS